MRTTIGRRGLVSSAVAVVAGLVAVGLAATVARSGPRLDPVGVAMAPALGVTAVLGLLLLLGVRGLDRFGAVSPRAALLALAWGAVVAVGIAAAANDVLTAVVGRPGGATVTAALARVTLAPVVEEVVKAAGVLAVALVVRRAVASPLHGMLLGMLSGLGFELVENVQSALADPASDTPGAVVAAARRAALGLLGSHWLYGAFTGLAIGLVLTGAARRSAVVIGLLGLLGPVIHAVHDVPGVLVLLGGSPAVAAVMTVATRVPALVVLALVVHRTLRDHGRRLVAALDTEPEDVAGADDQDRVSLSTRRLARRARRVARREGGRAAAAALRAVQRDRLALGEALLEGAPEDVPAALRERLRRRWDPELAMRRARVIGPA